MTKLSKGKKYYKDVVIVGFALFAMFFGAGNLIFPPFLGHEVGTGFGIASLGFILTGVGLPLLGIIAVCMAGGTFDRLAARIHPNFAKVFTAVLFIAIGPMLAIPRTAATTYELAVEPNFAGISPIVWMFIYFGINLIFVLRKSAIIDSIGTVLTPVLLAILAFLIVKGIIFPIGEVANTGAEKVFSSSLIEGYQTMDTLGALLFSSMITKSIIDKGYERKDVIPMTLKAGIIAAAGLALVYGGLTYLGAQTTSVFTGEATKSGILLFISNEVLGSSGTIIIGLAIALACLSTSIGLLCAGATFFEKLSGGKLSYNLNAIVISLISVCIGSMGIDKIVQISEPVLNILYPVAITLIITTLIKKKLKNMIVIRLGLLASFIVGILSVTSFDLSFIPLASHGFAWVIPTVITVLITLYFTKKDLDLIDEMNNFEEDAFLD